MICEYCGSNIRVVQDNGVCPNCGGVLNLSGQQATEMNAFTFPPPPFSIIRIREGYLELQPRGVRLFVKLPRVPRKDISIPYYEIFDVSYVPATKCLKGFLCVREWKDRHIPLPKTFWQKSLQDSIIWFEKGDNVAFYRAYEYLKQCAAINTKRQVTIERM